MRRSLCGTDTPVCAVEPTNRLASTCNMPSSRNACNSLETLASVPGYPELESGPCRASESASPSHPAISNRKLQELESPQLSENTASATVLIANFSIGRRSRSRAAKRSRDVFPLCIPASVRPCFPPSSNCKPTRALGPNHVESLLFGVATR